MKSEAGLRIQEFISFLLIIMIFFFICILYLHILFLFLHSLRISVPALTECPLKKLKILLFTCDTTDTPPAAVLHPGRRFSTHVLL